MPRWIGVAGAAGAVLQFVPLPVMPFLIGLQIELLRGAMIVGLGMLAVRSTSVDTSTDTREPVAASYPMPYALRNAGVRKVLLLTASARPQWTFGLRLRLERVPSTVVRLPKSGPSHEEATLAPNAQRRLMTVLAIAGVTLALGTACGSDGGSVAANPTSPSGAAKPAEITAACPLVDTASLGATFKVDSPQATENDPVKTGPATTYSCDIVDNGEVFLTVGVAVAPVSGTVEANVRAALSNKTGDPVSGIGDGGAYAETDGVGTAAGVKTVGSTYRLVFVHGAAGSKDEIVTTARQVAAKV